MSNLFAALSFDDGKTWIHRRLITDDARDHGVDTISNGRVLMGKNASEPAGYVSAYQARDGTIHVLSSINHYAFNMEWIKSGPPVAFKTVPPISLPRRDVLALSLSDGQRSGLQVGKAQWSAERTGDCDALDIRRGFTIEARIAFTPNVSDHFELRAYVRSGATMCNRYWLRADAEKVAYWYKGAWQPIAQASSGRAAHRLAVRNDTSVQIYCDGKLIATYRLPTRSASPRPRAAPSSSGASPRPTPTTRSNHFLSTSKEPLLPASDR